MKRFLALALLLLLLALAGCETVHGFGEDMQHAGRWMQNRSERTR